MVTLFVGNLPYSAADVDIALHFSAYDVVSAAMQHHDDTGRSKGFALVTVNNTDAANVSAQMHDTEFQGRKLIVREDRPPGDRPRREPRKERPSRESGGGSGGGGSGAGSWPEPAPCKVMFVGNLPWDVDSAQLSGYFPGRE